jgi:LDH2 family malate/lactate/ureidoglycolate dehydrogenase
MPRIAENEIRAFAEAVLTKSGLAAEDAVATADGLIQSTKRGVTTHGVFRLPQYCAAIRAGKINKAPQVKVLQRRGCTALVDAGGGYGYRPTLLAMDEAIALAREHGIAVVGVRDSHHFGAAAIYTDHAAEHGLIGIATTTTKARIAPTGARGAVVGNNPISIAVPRRPPHRPVNLDMALSQVALGRIRIAAANGTTVPEGWGFDGEGRSTTDPNAIIHGGLLAAIGGHKGYGLSVMVELLAGALTGSRFGLNADNHDHPKGGVGHLVIAIAPDFMRDIEAFYDDVETLVGMIKASPLADGSPGVYLPGEIEAGKAADADARGLIISSDLQGQLASLAAELGVPAPGYLS